LAAYWVACFASRRQAVVGGALVLAGVWLRVLWSGFAGPLELGFFGVLVVVPWLAGLASHVQRQRGAGADTRPSASRSASAAICASKAAWSTSSLLGISMT
jgi:hypothetical protein